jgi:hypothetical protein
MNLPHELGPKRLACLPGNHVTASVDVIPNLDVVITGE